MQNPKCVVIYLYIYIYTHVGIFQKEKKEVRKNVITMRKYSVLYVFLL